MSLGMELGRGPRDFVLHGNPSPLQTAGWMKVVLGMEVGLGPGDFVLDGDAVLFRQKGAEPLPNFRPISIEMGQIYCGQTARCIKMPLGMDVGLSPGDFVLDGDPVPPPKKGGGAPKFSAHVCMYPLGKGPAYSGPIR